MDSSLYSVPLYSQRWLLFCIKRNRLWYCTHNVMTSMYVCRSSSQSKHFWGHPCFENAMGSWNSSSTFTYKRYKVLIYILTPCVISLPRKQPIFYTLFSLSSGLIGSICLVICLINFNSTGAGLVQTLMAPSLRRVVVLAVAVALLQQLSGINTVIFYSSQILAKAGMSRPVIGSCLIGVINIVVTGISAVLVDSAGNRDHLFMNDIGYAQTGLHSYHRTR